jgi:outer membrane biosynthesis protein TonB
MPVGLGIRFLIEAGFLIGVAVAAGFARLGTVTIIVVMAAAWLLVAAVEWVLSRARARLSSVAPTDALAGPSVPDVPHEAPAVVEPVDAPAAAPAVVEPAAEPTSQAAAEPTVEPAATLTAEQREPEPAPEPEPDVIPGPSPEPAEPDREPLAEPTLPQTPPEQPRVAAVPPLSALSPAPAASQPAAVDRPQPDTVVALASRRDATPREWNLWELERVAREQSGGDTVRDEERTFVLMYLREFADADGLLPSSFDGVVRESFGDDLDAVRP